MCVINLMPAISREKSSTNKMIQACHDFNRASRNVCTSRQVLHSIPPHAVCTIRSESTMSSRQIAQLFHWSAAVVMAWLSSWLMAESFKYIGRVSGECHELLILPEKSLTRLGIYCVRGNMPYFHKDFQTQ